MGAVSLHAVWREFPRMSIKSALLASCPSVACVACLIIGDTALRGLEYLLFFLAVRNCSSFLFAVALHSSVICYAVWRSLDLSLMPGVFSFVSILLVLLYSVHSGLFVLLIAVVLSRVKSLKIRTRAIVSLDLTVVFLLCVLLELMLRYIAGGGFVFSPATYWGGTAFALMYGAIFPVALVGFVAASQYAIARCLGFCAMAKAVGFVMLLLILISMLPLSFWFTPHESVPRLLSSILVCQGISVDVNTNFTLQHSDTKSNAVLEVALNHFDVAVFGEGSHPPISMEQLRLCKSPYSSALLLCGAVATREASYVAGVGVHDMRWHVRSTQVTSVCPHETVRVKRKLLPAFESPIGGSLVRADDLSFDRFDGLETAVATLRLGDRELRVAIRICYEICFSDAHAGFFDCESASDICFAQVGNRWLRRGTYLDQQFKKCSQISAVLSGRWHVLACASHSSMLISPSGQVVFASPEGTSLWGIVNGKIVCFL